MRALPALLAAAAVACVACAPSPSAGPDPFGTAEDSGPRGDRLYVVQLQVTCNGCAVAYQVGGSSRSVRAQSSGWATVLRLFPRYPLRVSLSATGSVREVRILVDGEVAAAADGDASTSGSVQVEAVVPRPADAPAPDTLESRRERVNSAS